MQSTQVKSSSRSGSPPVQAVRNIGVVGSRSLPFGYAGKVGQVTDDLVARGYHIATGGALGADQFCLERVITANQASKCVIFSAWQNYAGFPVKVRPFVREARKYGASVLWGWSTGKECHSAVRLALLKRNERLVEACYGLAAFMMPASKGTSHTVSLAVKAHLPVVVFPVNCEPPQYRFVKWVPLRCGGCWEGAFKAVYLR